MLLRSFALQMLSAVAALYMVLPVLGIKGDSGCGVYLCVNATLVEDVVTYELTALKKPFGWIAIGWGNRMNGSDMVIMWNNEDGTTTLAQRRGMGHSEPLPVEYPRRRANITRITPWHPRPAATLAFSVYANNALLKGGHGREHLIWAYSLTRPDGNETWSEVPPHITAGFFRLDFNKEYIPKDSHSPRPVIETISDDPEPFSSDTPEYRKKHERIIIAHGVIASIGFLVILPAGSLFARWARTLTPKWFTVHQGLMLIAVPVITVGWVLGPIAVMERQAAHLFDAHQISGVLLAILYYIQLSLGRYIHRRRSSALPGSSLHPPSNILHICLGLTIIVLAFFQTRSGMEEWKIATGKSYISNWCHELWKVWVIIIPVAYLLGTVMLPRQVLQEKNGNGVGNYSSLSEHAGFVVSDDETLHKRASLDSVELTREINELEGTQPLLRAQER